MTSHTLNLHKVKPVIAQQSWKKYYHALKLYFQILKSKPIIIMPLSSKVLSVQCSIDYEGVGHGSLLCVSHHLTPRKQSVKACLMNYYQNGIQNEKALCFSKTM